MAASAVVQLLGTWQDDHVLWGAPVRRQFTVHSEQRQMRKGAAVDSDDVDARSLVFETLAPAGKARQVALSPAVQQGHN